MSAPGAKWCFRVSGALGVASFGHFWWAAEVTGDQATRLFVHGGLLFMAGLVLCAVGAAVAGLDESKGTPHGK